MITRRCLLTLDGGGVKIQAILNIPKPTKAMFPEVMERKFIESFNKTQPIRKAVAVHIMRN